MRATANAMKSARRFRRDLSRPEYLLWLRLRSKRGDLRFRRQHPIGNFVADFYCPAAKTAIEIDGAHHDFTQDADVARASFFADLGITTERLAAAHVLADPDAVADAIVRLCRARAGAGAGDGAGPSTPQPDG